MCNFKFTTSISRNNIHGIIANQAGGVWARIKVRNVTDHKQNIFDNLTSFQLDIRNATRYKMEEASIFKNSQFVVNFGSKIDNHQ